jgi:hypothetical protein
MAEVTKKELGDALQLIAEQFHEVDKSVAKIAAAVAALKAVLAIQMNPSAPKQALERIQNLEDTFAKLDPNIAARVKFDEILEIVKLVEKQGGPKEA